MDIEQHKMCIIIIVKFNANKHRKGLLATLTLYLNREFPFFPVLILIAMFYQDFLDFSENFLALNSFPLHEQLCILSHEKCWGENSIYFPYFQFEVYCCSFTFYQ